ncbi:tyrosine-type recombinase/integrase [Hufsiella ginkgonis]|uniref:Site-specific integrase n=1 Tax=Hufsiella ginkgonis TaxID=2695274 RepID=A0A7K1XT39_9SPHI|nr:site-specific integrase [Hufsiella ginkgonis]MXV14161.1 site-specific integrase [Hufsiella ginkgonis]
MSPLSFEDYLSAQRFSPHTVNQYRRYAACFTDWMDGQSLVVEQVGHSETLDYADQLRKEGRSINQVNKMLIAVRYYFAWLIGQGKAAHNPASGLRLKGTVRSVPHGLLEKAELEKLYESYGVNDERTHRNKVMLGLMVYQGITSEGLHDLRAEHLKLREGKILIPATGTLNARMLRLESHQVLDLQEYVLAIRPKILADRSKERPGRKPEAMKEADAIRQLFISMNGSENIKNGLYHLGRALKKIEPKYRDPDQIRQSVITNWLKEKNLRVVQYMAGHRYVSSTERYKTTNLEDLKEALNKFHPMNKKGG